MQNPNLSPTHFTTLRTILGRVNPYVNVFIRAANHLIANPIKEVHICIIASRTPGNEDVDCYNVPMANEVTMIIPSEPREVGNRNVIVQR
jgi:hypothetical protein